MREKKALVIKKQCRFNQTGRAFNMKNNFVFWCLVPLFCTSISILYGSTIMCFSSFLIIFSICIQRLYWPRPLKKFQFFIWGCSMEDIYWSRFLNTYLWVMFCIFNCIKINFKKYQNFWNIYIFFQWPIIFCKHNLHRL